MKCALAVSLLPLIIDAGVLAVSFVAMVAFPFGK